MSAEKLLTDIQQQHEVTQVLKVLLEDGKLASQAVEAVEATFRLDQFDTINRYRALLKQRLFGEGTL